MLYVQRQTAWAPMPSDAACKAEGDASSSAHIAGGDGDAAGAGAPADAPVTETAAKRITWDEVKAHNRKEDCWIVIEDRVYDVTRWLHSHPGGVRTISNFAGNDATFHFKFSHGAGVWDKLPEWYIGELAP